MSGHDKYSVWERKGWEWDRWCGRVVQDGEEGRCREGSKSRGMTQEGKGWEKEKEGSNGRNMTVVVYVVEGKGWEDGKGWSMTVYEGRSGHGERNTEIIRTWQKVEIKKGRGSKWKTREASKGQRMTEVVHERQG